MAITGVSGKLKYRIVALIIALAVLPSAAVLTPQRALSQTPKTAQQAAAAAARKDMAAPPQTAPAAAPTPEIPPAAAAASPPPNPPQAPPSSSPAAVPDSAAAASPLKTEVTPKIPPRPDDPHAAKVYTLLETHCARCHQAGKTETPLTSGTIANILAVGAVASDPLLIKPGLPDASRLYEVIVSRHAPLEIYAGLPQLGEPEPDDIEALRTWIKDLPPTSQGCTDRKIMTAADVDELALAAVTEEKEDARDLRFISLANLYNLCASDADLEGYRQAITKVLNSLSWSNDPAPVAVLGSAGAVLSFKLSDLGWVSGHWDILQRIYPRGLHGIAPEALRTATATDVPVLRADWFADAASKPPLYYALLGIPSKLAELAKINGIDIEQNIKAARARRMLVRNSPITRGNRLVERHAGGRGAMWLTYDFASNTGEQDLFERPLGPKASSLVKTPFKPDAVRVAFVLPNGFLGFALFDAAGNRIDRLVPGLEKPLAGGDEGAFHDATRAGANCFGCHAHGLKPVRDDFRNFALSEKFTASKDVKDQALALYANDTETLGLWDGDQDRYRNALKAAAIDPDLLIGGIEPINALASRYLAKADAQTTAAQQGLDLASFQKALMAAPVTAAPLARRLQHGVLARPDLDRLLTLLTGPDDAAGSQGNPKTLLKDSAKDLTKDLAGVASDSIGAVRLNVWVDKARPMPGDLISVNAEADSDCFLTIVSIDPAGKATVLFPNDFEPDNLVTAGKTVRVPGSEAPYQLRVKETGYETLLAQCSTSPTPPVGIEHDFERQRFTVLGNWENFVHDALVTEADIRRNPDKAERARSARAGALQRRQDRGEHTERRQDTAPGRVLRDGRAVVVIGNG